MSKKRDVYLYEIPGHSLLLDGLSMIQFIQHFCDDKELTEMRIDENLEAPLFQCNNEVSLYDIILPGKYFSAIDSRIQTALIHTGIYFVVISRVNSYSHEYCYAVPFDISVFDTWEAIAMIKNIEAKYNS